MSAASLTRQILRAHDGELAWRHDFTDQEREILLCGGLLAYLSGRAGDPATASGGAGIGTEPQREERGQALGGRAE